MANRPKTLPTPAHTVVLAPDDPRWQLVGRIVASRAFSKSPRLREFLLFVTEKSLKGELSSITEVEIGLRIFGRNADFIPTEDSIVRVSARQLRAKLKEYFEDEGRLEHMQVNIPKGGYLPAFEERSHPPGAARPKKGWRALPRSWQIGIASAAAVNLALLLAVAVLLRRPATVAPATQAAQGVLGAFLSKAQTPVHVVVSDYSLSLMRHGSAGGGRDYKLDEYLGWNYDRLRPESRSDPRLRDMFEILRTHRITRLGDLVVAQRIQRAAAGGAPILVRHSRDVTLRDFESGWHIVLGNPYSTPWVSLFEDQLNFRSIRDAREGVGYANLKPRAGEAVNFLVHEASKEEGLGYARVALLPNAAGKQRVLLIGGVNMVTMEAAGEFVSNADSLPEVLHSLGLKEKDALPNFELVLETRALDNTPQKARIIASAVINSRARAKAGF